MDELIQTDTPLTDGRQHSARRTIRATWMGLCVWAGAADALADNGWEGQILSAHWDNDVAVKTDRHYTQAARVAYQSRDNAIVGLGSKKGQRIRCPCSEKSSRRAATQKPLGTLVRQASVTAQRLTGATERP